VEDLHFMERLGRVSLRHTELALELYRDPELVRFVLGRVDAPEAPRIALSLDHPQEGPFVIVTRDGRFVTCLGQGMLVGDIPVVTRARLDRLGEQHLELRTQRAFIESALDDGAVKKLIGALYGRAHRLPSETMATLTMLAPLMIDTLERRLFSTTELVRGFLATSERYIKRATRLSARDCELLEAFWIDLWTISHLVVLVHSLDSPMLESRCDVHERAAGTAGGVFAALLGPLGVPFWPLQLRCFWAAGRMGKRALKGCKEAIAMCATLEPEGAGFALAMASIAFKHPKLRAEISKALRVATPAPGEAQAFVWRNLCATLVDQYDDPDKSDRLARATCYMAAAELQRLPPPEFEEALGQYDSPQGRERVFLGRSYCANVFTDVFSLGKERLLRTVRMLPFYVRSPGEDLYWSEHTVTKVEATWKPDMSLSVIEACQRTNGLIYAERPRAARAEATPERNSPCTCGSGKKYKRCCGA